MHGLTETQKKMRLKGHKISLPKIGLDYMPERPDRISVKKRNKVASSQHITVEVNDNSNQENFQTPSRMLVFDHIEVSSPLALWILALKRLSITRPTKNQEAPTHRSAFEQLRLTKPFTSERSSVARSTQKQEAPTLLVVVLKT